MSCSHQLSGQHQAWFQFQRHRGCSYMDCPRTGHQPNIHQCPLACTASGGDGIALDMGRPVLESQSPAGREGGQGSGFTSPILEDLSTRSQDTITENVRARWVGALRELREEAFMLGIPCTALPTIPDSASLEEYRGIHQHLSGMIASIHELFLVNVFRKRHQEYCRGGSNLWHAAHGDWPLWE